jgi:hypothetical protein
MPGFVQGVVQRQCLCAGPRDTCILGAAVLTTIHTPAFTLVCSLRSALVNPCPVTIVLYLAAGAWQQVCPQSPSRVCLRRGGPGGPLEAAL